MHVTVTVGTKNSKKQGLIVFKAIKVTVTLV